ncbi:DUF1127 domain-containing protein [Mesorhizobium sp. CN2-181]|uniref:DUF1127 domain-containing protein n=1 Tax=Mesorhizobium yinganensis TaxID=3157707 RepID=UPI0032B745A4
MNQTLAPASAPNQVLRSTASTIPANASGGWCSLAALHSKIAAWEERKRFRWHLARMSKDDPHLIDDIGLTRQQVEAEIKKPFWQA